MINYYQPFLLPFLGLKQSKLPHEIKRLYYHSFEDALWDLLAKKCIQKGATVLIPDFYCMDVVENIRRHGYTVVFYPVNAHFQISRKKLDVFMRRFHPSVVILFHSCGITNRVLTPSWVKHHPNMLIVEDCVHRLVNPASVLIFGDNHFIIDSLRKVSPIPGSFMYGTRNGLSFERPKKMCTGYVLTSFFWYSCFRATLQMSTLLRYPRGMIYAHQTLLKHHDDVIGDHLLPASGISWVGAISNWFDHKKISTRKAKQAVLYKKLTRTLPHALFYPINIPRKDFGALHVYPVGMHSIPDGFIKQLHERGIVVWCKFEDSPWATHSHVLFLPLGFHISDKKIRSTVLTIHQLTMV